MGVSQAPMSEETRHILATARRLRDEVLHPAERLLDALPEPDELPEHATYVGALDQAREIGIHSVTLPDELGGLGAGWDVGMLLAAEVAAGAAGFAAQLVSEGLLTSLVARVATATQVASGPFAGLLADESSGPAPGAFAVFQSQGGAEGTLSLPGELSLRSIRHRTNASSTGEIVHDGETIRARGVRIPQVANGDRATHLVLVVGDTDGSARTHVVDLTAGGVSRSGTTSRMGLRMHAHADLVLDDLVLPPPALDRERTAALLESVLVANALAMVAISLGTATNSYDHGLDYCRTRVQGGIPIIGHQSVAWNLWRASSSIDVVRMAFESALATGDGLPDLRTAISLRTVASEMVSRVTIDILELLGGYGVTTEYHTEKLYRDARVLCVPAGQIEGPGVDAPVSLL